MNTLRILFPILRNNHIGNYYVSNLLKNTSCCSYIQKNYSMQNKEVQELVTKEKIQVTKPTLTIWKRPPFAKNLFCGKFDTVS